MKFQMPATVEGQIEMHNAMLQKVLAALQSVADHQSTLLHQLERKAALGLVTKEDITARKNLRLQELCLKDQERRLQERILCLQTGSSISG